MEHRAVLLHEAIESLNLKPGLIYFDGTLGGSGHSMKVCSDFGSKVRIIGVDRDVVAINNAKNLFSKTNCKYDFILSDYRNMNKVVGDLKLRNVDAILLDLGLSSDQLESSGRGFTFKKDEPLKMTFSEDINTKLTADIILNNWSEENIANIIYAYSDEIYSRRIAKAIIDARDKSEIKTTGELVEIIRNAVPAKYRNGKIHFATKTFQSLRIAVNDEIGALKDGMENGWNILNINGRMAIISFHSVEDREVKNFFRDKAKAGEGRLINKKPVIPKDQEIDGNPRSRSAKLRVIEKIK